MGSNYPGWKLAVWEFLWVKIFRVEIVLGRNFQGENCLRGSHPGWEFSEWELSGWELSLVGIFWVEIVWVEVILRGNFFLMGVFQMKIARSESSWWQFSGNLVLVLADK